MTDKNIFLLFIISLLANHYVQPSLVPANTTSTIHHIGCVSLSDGQYFNIDVMGDVTLKNISCQSLTVHGHAKLENCKIAHINVQGCISIVTSVIEDITVTGGCHIYEVAVDSIVVDGDLSIDNSSIKNIEYTGLKVSLKKSFVSDSILVHASGPQSPSIVLDDVLVLGSVTFDSVQLGLVQLIGQDSYVCPERVANSNVYRMQWS